MVKDYGIETPSGRSKVVLNNTVDELNKIIKKFSKKEIYIDDVNVLNELVNVINKSINKLS